MAELEFSFGRTRAASDALDRSLSLAPRNAQALALKGFLLAARNNTREALNNPDIFDLVYAHTFNSRLTYTQETLFGVETNTPGIGTATWFGG